MKVENNISNELIYSKIGMALIEAQRVEFMAGELVGVLENFEGGKYRITTEEFLAQAAKSSQRKKTLGAIFNLLKLNSGLVVEKELELYLTKRNIFVHQLWKTHMSGITTNDTKSLIEFLNDFGQHSQRMDSFFKGFIYFLLLRYVKDRDDLAPDVKKWSGDFDYFFGFTKGR